LLYSAFVCIVWVSPFFNAVKWAHATQYKRYVKLFPNHATFIVPLNNPPPLGPLLLQKVQCRLFFERLHDECLLGVTIHFTLKNVTIPLAEVVKWLTI
jgi:hypothetical protein